ncbi:MAG: DUF2971 domain-containing protein [Rhodoferax sp.]
MSTDPGTLYHYCSTEAFVSMLKGRSFWLSSLKLSNDTMEGRLVTSTLMRFAERDCLDQSAARRLRESIELMERLFHGLGFCLSEDGDLLSQWRGYADDARGVAVGFSHAYLNELAAQPRPDGSNRFAIARVEYDEQQHEAGIEPNYRELRNLIDAGAFRFPGLRSLLDSRTPEEIAADDEAIGKAHRGLLMRILLLAPKLYQLKAPAFREEREWRLVSISTDSAEDDVSFRGNGARVIPFRSIELTQSEIAPLSEVVLGPRHETPESTVQAFLKSVGYGEVRVRRSAATYR